VEGRKDEPIANSRVMINVSSKWYMSVSHENNDDNDDDVNKINNCMYILSSSV